MTRKIYCSVAAEGGVNTGFVFSLSGTMLHAGIQSHTEVLAVSGDFG